MKDTAKLRFQLGILLVFLYGLFTFGLGAYNYVKVASYYSIEHWLTVFLSQPYSNGSKPKVPQMFYVLGTLSGTNLVMTGVLIMSLAWFGLRQRIRWCWWLAVFAMIWTGLNNTFALLWFQMRLWGFAFWPFVPTLAGLTGLLLTSPDIPSQKQPGTTPSHWSTMNPESLRKRIAWGALLGGIACSFPTIVGMNVFYKILSLYSVEHWLTVFQGLPYSNGAKQVIHFIVYVIGHLGAANLIMTGIGAMTVAYFGIGSGLRWCWWLVVFTVGWVGINDTVLTTWFYLRSKGFPPLPIIPTTLGTIALIITKELCLPEKISPTS